MQEHTFDTLLQCRQTCRKKYQGHDHRKENLCRISANYRSFLANNDKHTSFLTHFHENWEIFVLTPIIVVISLLKLISHLWFIWRFYLKRGQLKGSVHLHLKWIKWREFYNDNSLKEGVHCLLYHNKLPIKRFLKCISNHPDAFLLLFILFFLSYVYLVVYSDIFIQSIRRDDSCVTFRSTIVRAFATQMTIMCECLSLLC